MNSRSSQKALRDFDEYIQWKGGDVPDDEEPLNESFDEYDREMRHLSDIQPQWEYRIIMSGSRTWTDEAKIREVIRYLKSKHGTNLVIVVGDEPNGADRIVHQICEEEAIAHEIYCATTPKYKDHALLHVTQVSDWRIDGRGAGPKRNGIMVSQGLEELIAFRRDGKSNGTDGMIKLVSALRKKITMHTQEA